MDRGRGGDSMTNTGASDDEEGADRTPSPDELLGEFLEQHSINDDAAFDELLRRHPNCAEYLRRLAGYVRGALGGGSTPRDSSIPPRLVPLIARLRRLEARDLERFEERDVIGEGGMGIVLGVHDNVLQRDLARKAIRAERLQSDRGDRPLERFIAEAQITAQLDHPGVVPVHDLGLDPAGNPYFTMRRVRGEDLGAVFLRAWNGEPDWSLARVIGLMLRVCETMAYAHSKNVIHRDLKPANVMVGRFGEVYVMDWGLARALGKPDPRDLRLELAPPTTTLLRTATRDEGTPDEVLITGDGAILGTPCYMSPEQARGDLAAIGKSTDIYAVGAMLYELLARHKPYCRPGVKTTGRALLRWIHDGPPHPLNKITPDAPEPLIAIAEKSMAREPDARYASMSKMADDLRAWLEGRVVVAHRTGALAELQSWVRRNRKVAATALLLGLVLIFASALIAWQYRLQIDVEREARSERDLRLDIRDADALIHETEHLWPVHPHSIPRYDDWLARTAALVHRCARYGSLSIPVGNHVVELDTRELAERNKMQTLVDTIRDIDSLLANPNLALESRAKFEVTRVATAEELTWRENRAVRDRLAYSVTAADSVARNAREPNADAFRIQARIDFLTDVSHGLIGEVRRRRELAATLEQRSLSDYASEWTGAIAAIRDPARSPSYRGLNLTPQVGLVPLGPDPLSGLHEFWHVLSGERPVRGSDGRYKIDGATGLIFVLIPGGEFAIGAQRGDPNASLYDEHARDDELVWTVELDPFLLSKYEMTLGQWSRIGDSVPAEYHAGYPPGDQPIPDFAHPVESVAWYEVSRVLARWSVDLPTEAQWEVAARGGRMTSSSILPKDENSLRSVNTYDSGPGGTGSFRDGYTVHAAVDHFDPNPYGLFNTLGNVAEYCADWYHWERPPTRGSKPDALVTPSFFELKAERGGHYLTLPIDLRFAHRDKNKPEHGRKTTGVRPRCPLIRLPE
jgi:serine/threonine protein kinase/formylglycine-generating enzyme required for sulfatase activity